MITYVITQKDTGCPHSCRLLHFDDPIVIPDPDIYTDVRYQFFVDVPSSIEKQILTMRILQELYEKQVSSCEINLVGIQITKKIQAVLKLLSEKNKVEIYK